MRDCPKDWLDEWYMYCRYLWWTFVAYFKQICTYKHAVDGQTNIIIFYTFWMKKVDCWSFFRSETRFFYTNVGENKIFSFRHLLFSKGPFILFFSPKLAIIFHHVELPHFQVEKPTSKQQPPNWAHFAHWGIVRVKRNNYFIHKIMGCEDSECYQNIF